MNPDILDLAEEAVGQQLGVPVMNWSMHGIKEHEALFKTLTFPAFTRFVICEGSKKNLRYWKFHSACMFNRYFRPETAIKPDADPDHKHIFSECRDNMYVN